MGAVTTVGTFLDNLVTVLTARAGLAGVNIYSASIDDLSAGQEAIVFAVEASQSEYENPTMAANETFENYTIEGRTWVTKPGAGETVIKAARDRALALIEEVHDALTAYDTTAAYVAALGVDKARVQGWKLEQYIGDGYRDCRLSFTIHVKAHFTPA